MSWPQEEEDSQDIEIDQCTDDEDEYFSPEEEIEGLL